MEIPAFTTHPNRVFLRVSWLGCALALSGKKFELMDIAEAFAVGYIDAHIDRVEEKANGTDGSFDEGL